MIILQIEHPVQNYEAWKKVYDSDPMDRKGSGVKSSRISRLADNPKYIFIELEFDNLKDAENMLMGLLKLWNKVEGNLIQGAKGRITEVLEIIKY